MTKSPGLMAVAILSLGLGIGLNLTVFGVFESMFLRGVSAADPSHTVHVWVGGGNRTSYINFRDLRDSKAVAQLAGYTLSQFALGDGDNREKIYGQAVAGDYFEMLGVKPALGRAFTAEERVPENNAQVAILSHPFWKSRFRGDPGVLGKTLRLNGRPFTIVGVLPAGYRSIHGFALAPPFYVPYSGVIDAGFRERAGAGLELVARLAPNQTREQATAALLAQAKELERLYPKEDRGYGQARVFGISVFEVLNTRQGGANIVLVFFAILSVLVGLILLIACANVAGILIARAVGRRREIAVRLAVGAARGRLVRLLLTESALLAALGLVAAAMFYAWGVQAIGRIDLPIKETPIDLSPELNWRIALYCVAAAAITAIACGIGPALEAARANVSDGLKNEIAAAARGRLFTVRNTLVIGQVAVSLLLLVVSLLFVRSLRDVQTVDPGFNVSNELVAEIRHDDPKGDALQQTDAVLDALAKLPGVRSAAGSVIVPLSQNSWQTAINLDGDAGRRAVVQANSVTPRYFDTMGVRLLAGREFSDRDTSSSPRVAIVNQAFAAKFWPGQNAIGRTVTFGVPKARGQWETVQIVGVVATTKHVSLGEEPTPVLYVNYQQETLPIGFRFTIRTERPAIDMLAPVRAALSAMEPRAIIDLKPMSENIELSTMPNRIGAALLGFLGAMGLVLASIGLYGVLAYTVTRRVREIGIRIALGASKSDVLAAVLGQAMALVGIGVAVGLALALAATRPLATFLSSGVSVTDPVSLAVVVVVLAFTGVAAAFVPARRALRVDPMTALRYE